MKSNAIFSACKKYRYALWRTWDDSNPSAMFIGLNPSTADELIDDPTINRCISYSKSWGFGGLIMANLFAFRATKPIDMITFEEPIGPKNDEWIIKLSMEAGIVIAAWGNEGSHLGRSLEIRKLIPNLSCLKINKSGEPSHPLYLCGNLKYIKLH